jgi:hypothetical protein
MNYDHLRPFATPKQITFLDAIASAGSIRAAGRAIGTDQATIQRSLTSLKAYAAAKGVAPESDMVHGVPDPFVVRGVSTYYDKSGKPAGQWVKSKLDDERVQAMIAASYAAMAETLPRIGATSPPDITVDALCNVYTMTDCHMGMLAWHQEGGSDWDLKIAERILTGCFEHMVAASPAARVGVVAQLGDFLHSDGLLPVTPTGGNLLDQDGRFSKIVQASIRVLRRMVDFALARHEHVIVLMAEGNHDMASSIWLRALFRALYEDESRVQVIDSEMPYYIYQHGKTMLAWHHGHLKKIETLPLLFASEFPRVWGSTSKRYCHTGHKHHTDEKEYSGMSVHQHPTLASRDSYASRHGWIAERQVTSITYHSEYGQVARNTVTPEMLSMVQVPL